MNSLDVTVRIPNGTAHSAADGGDAGPWRGGCVAAEAADCPEKPRKKRSSSSLKRLSYSLFICFDSIFILYFECIVDLLFHIFLFCLRWL